MKNTRTLLPFLTITLLLSLLFIFNFLVQALPDGPQLEYVMVNGTVNNFTNPANPLLINATLNGTVILNITFVGNDSDLNISNITIFFHSTEDPSRIFNGNTSINNITNVPPGHVYIGNYTNISINTRLLPDGNYNLTINITNSSGSPNLTNAAGRGTTVNLTITNITIDNFAPAITFVSSTPANDTYQKQNDRILVNVTVNDTTPINVTFTFANSTTVNQTTYINYWINQGGNSTAQRLFGRNISINFSLVGVQDYEERWTYNVTVNDALLRSNTSLTRTLYVDGLAPRDFVITSSGGTSIRENTATTMKCSVTDNYISTLTLKRGTTQICSSTSTSCEGSFTPVTDGSFLFTCTGVDKSGNSAEGTFTLTVTESGGVSGGAGGAGGGGAGGASRSVILGTVAAGESSTVRVADSTIGVHEVSFTAKNTLSSARVVVTARAEDQVSDKPQNPVYKYFDVNTQNFDDGDVTSGRITFMASESWLSQQNKRPEDVVLLRLEGTTWKEYSARLLGVEKGIMRFQSTVPGFSTFAIALKGVAAPKEVPVPTVTPEETVGTPEPEVKKGAGRTVLVVLLLLVIIGAVVYLVVQKKRQR